MRSEDRIAQMLEDARQRVHEEDLRRPPPTPHWQEAAEDREEREPAPLELDAGNIVARGSACARLRKLLADGAWHSALELVEVGGLRYGGRLHEIRRGMDGAPALDVEAEARAHRGRQVWWYRAAPASTAAGRG